jgi:DNA-binding FadR family transcriptional regulator
LDALAALPDKGILGMNRTALRPMRKPRKNNLTYEIVEQIGQEIVTGVYREGAPFPIEADLGTRFDASRTVVREAVKMLTAKRLLSSKPRQGTRVEAESHWNLLDPDVLRWMLERKFSLKLLSELTELRIAVEPMAAALAASNSTPATLAPIRHGIERMKAADRGEDDALESDIAFHVAILHATDNRFFAQLEEVIDTTLRISIGLTNRAKGVPHADIDMHSAVLKAIEEGNPQKARSAMQAVLDEVSGLIENERIPDAPCNTPGKSGH